jgi:hypothetical protein
MTLSMPNATMNTMSAMRNAVLPAEKQKRSGTTGFLVCREFGNDKAGEPQRGVPKAAAVGKEKLRQDHTHLHEHFEDQPNAEPIEKAAHR